MSLDVLNEYARQIVLRDIGLEGQEKLMEGRVAIIGLGGLGSPMAMLLASMGVGYLKLVDRDVVSLTDLHRQPLYRRGDVDLPKAEVAANRLREINPRITIDSVMEPVMEENVYDIISDVDLVLDGLDSMRARYILNRAVVRLRKPYVFASAIEMYGNVSTIIPYDTPCLECFYGGLEDAGLPTCAEVGVHPSITTIVAGYAVAEAVRILIGSEPRLRNTLLYIDLRDMSTDKIKVLRNPDCPVCGVNPREEPKPIHIPRVEVSCARDGRGIIFINRRRRVSLDKVMDNASSLGLTTVRKSNNSLVVKVDSNISLVILSSGVMIGKIRRYVDGLENVLMNYYDKLVD